LFFIGDVDTAADAVAAEASGKKPKRVIDPDSRAPAVELRLVFIYDLRGWHASAAAEACRPHAVTRDRARTRVRQLRRREGDHTSYRMLRSVRVFIGLFSSRRWQQRTVRRSSQSERPRASVHSGVPPRHAAESAGQRALDARVQEALHVSHDRNLKLRVKL
jgi:hypothetical protein